MGALSMWRDNPVMVKEFRVRMRGARAYWIITGYLLFLSFILFMQYSLWWNNTQAEGHNLASGSKIGQEFLLWITVTQAFLVAFITPAITSGAITIEREQRTLEMLELTRLSPGHVVFGKLSSAVGFVVLLLISSLPLASICFFLGGVSPEQIGYTYLMLMAGAFVAGTLGLVWSSVARTTAAAVILTYGTLFAPFLLFFLVGIVSTSSGPGWEAQLLIDNLLGIFGIPFAGEDYSPIAVYYRYWDHVRYYGLTLPVWLPGVLSFGMIGIVLAATAAVRLAARPETRSGLLRWLIVGIFVEQTFFFFGARFCAHTSAAPVAVAQMLTAYPLVLHLLYPVLLLLLVAPVFCTGEVRPSEARRFAHSIASGWKRVGWGNARFAAGWPYMCVLVLIVVGMFAFSFMAVGHGAEAMEVRIGAGGTAPPARSGMGAPMGVPTPPTPTVPAQTSGHPLLQIVTMLLVTVTGLFFLGMFLSLACANRWVAMMLMYVAIALVLVGPFLALASYRAAVAYAGGVPTTPSVFINLFYLNPLFSIAQIGDPSGATLRNVPLTLGQVPPWEVTTVCYGAMALLSIVLSAPFVTRTAARSVLPYEGLGTRA